MTLAPVQKLQVDEVGNSAYMRCPVAGPIVISKELVVSGVKGIDLTGDNPNALSLTFELRGFVDGVDMDVPVIILDISADREVYGIQIPHYSDFHHWLVPHVDV